MVSASHERYWIIGLISAAVILYAPFVSHPFVGFDDTLLIENNPVVQELSGRTVWYAFTSYDPELYIPLTLLSYQLEHAFFGMQSTVFHITNLLLHIASSLLIFSILRKLTDNVMIAGLTMALFLFHPLNVEVVLWASARKDVLSACFFLASWQQYLQYKETDVEMSYWRSLGMFGLALLAKVTVLFLPLVLLMSDWLQGRRITAYGLREKGPYIFLSLLFGIIALFGKASNLDVLSLWQTMLLGLKAISFYAQKLLFPAGLSIIYPQLSEPSLFSMEFALPVAVVIVLTAMLVIAFRRAKWAAFGIALFLLALMPSLATFYKNGFIMFASDRYAYIAEIGLLLCISTVLARIYAAGDRGRLIASACSVVILLLFAVTSFKQAHVWNNASSLFQNVVELYPASALAHNTIGSLVEADGNIEEAQTYYRKALDIDAGYALPALNMARYAIARNDLIAAEKLYADTAQSLRDKKAWSRDDVNAFAVYGQFLEDQRRYAEAFAIFEEAVEKAPHVAQAWYNLGLKYMERAQTDDAIMAFEKVMSIQSNSVDAAYRLAGLYAEKGRLQDAEQALVRVLFCIPDTSRHANILKSFVVCCANNLNKIRPGEPL